MTMPESTTLPMHPLGTHPHPHPNSAASAPVPIALVRGQPWAFCPKDLYIPPTAMAVSLEDFSGPLDLLLYLIKRGNIDILDIPIVTITNQYLEYVEQLGERGGLSHTNRLGQLPDLAVEYLTMAATLAEIKSRMLLPKPPLLNNAVEADPRARLVQQLQEYAQFKLAAQYLDALPRLERDLFLAQAALPNLHRTRPLPVLVLTNLTTALSELLRQVALFHHHRVVREPLSVQERMVKVLNALNGDSFTPFAKLLLLREGRPGVVVTFIAVLELLKMGAVEIAPSDYYAPLYIRACTHNTQVSPN